jgi:hypothetical protein
MPRPPVSPHPITTRILLAVSLAAWASVGGGCQDGLRERHLAARSDVIQPGPGNQTIAFFESGDLIRHSDARTALSAVAWSDVGAER